MSVAIRAGNRDDLPAILEIYNHAVRTSVATFDLEPAQLEERVEWLAQFGDEHPLFVAHSGGTVVGFAYYLPYRQKPGYRSTKETTVYIAPDWQRRGVGQALMVELIDHATRAGVHVLVAVLGGENPASAGLHERLGFERIGVLREVGYKFGGWVDTVFYQKVLDG